MSAAFDRLRLTSARLPVIQQNQLAECGLACLAMVARYHGHEVDLPGLRRRFPISLKGTSLERLIAIADQMDLDARPLRVEIEHLKNLRTPCILHWNLNHFVVLKKADRHGIEIHDPANGKCRLTMAEASRHFTGVALELQPSVQFTPIRQRQSISLRALTGHIRGLKSALLQVLMLALALEAFTLLLPLAMQWVLDDVLVTADLSLLTLLGVGFLLVVFFQALMTAMRGWVVAGIGASMSAQWVTNLFGHLLRLPLDYFEKRQVGQVMSRFISVEHIRRTLTGSFVEALLDGLTVALVLVVMSLYSSSLTVLVLSLFLLYCLLRAVSYRHLYLLNEEQLTYSARQQSQIIETLHGMQAIKLANKPESRRTRVGNTTIEVANREARIQRLTATYSALSKLLFGGQRVLLIWLGARSVLQGNFSAGMLVVFVAYAEMFATRAGTLIDRLVDLRLLKLHGHRIADIALQAPEQQVNTGYTGAIPAASIAVQTIYFRYAEGEPWVLRNCSMQINAGESVAIVGPSGCGKTTLAKILLGLLLPDSGQILIGGIDIRRFGLGAYRELFGAVMQDDQLFAGSIADNIAFFDGDSDLPAIEAAARSAQIHDDIMAMPMGYETLVGDMGSALSGGQKQRVLLARALYRKPKILLLDEATSHLDVARERAINQAIANMQLTRIIIAHRPETIASADRVILLRDESIEQVSSKDLASHSEYQELLQQAAAAGEVSE